MKTMPGAHDEGARDNPPVRSKFDKSQGKGLPAPHLKHPGEVAKETGSRHPGHNENGHKLPTERSVGLGGSHLRHNYTPGEMGAPIITGTGQGHAKNSRLTDGDVVHHSRNVTYGAMKPHLKEPDPVHAGSDSTRSSTISPVAMTARAALRQLRPLALVRSTWRIRASAPRAVMAYSTGCT